MSKALLQDLEIRFGRLTRGFTPPELYEPIAYTLSLGGKRIRPQLVFLGCELFDGDIEKAAQPAMAIELFHNFTLLHDDIMDRAPLRRGKETVYRKWNENIAILSGDTLFVMAYDHLSATDPEFLPEILRLFTTTAREVCEGQQYDMNFETMPVVTIPQYLEMIRLKTAVLLACSLKTGAVIAGAPGADTETLYSFGQNIGMAFQLQDDLLDTYGEVQTFGKEIGGDISCSKKTYLYVQAMEVADEEMRGLLDNIYNSSNGPVSEKIRKVRALFDELGIQDLTREKINVYFDLALADLKKIQVPEEKKKDLTAMANKLLNRTF